MLSPGQLQRYLEHLKLSEADLKPSLATLTAVHRQHMRSIPFANVTVARVPDQLMSLDFPKASPDTSTDGIFTKLIDRKWCDTVGRRLHIHDIQYIVEALHLQDSLPACTWTSEEGSLLLQGRILFREQQSSIKGSCYPRFQSLQCRW